MAWHSIAPIGNISVKANKTILQDNTTYIEDTMGKSVVGTNKDTTRDHFWDVDSSVDGRHRFIQSVGFTSTEVFPDDVYPALGAGMQSILFPLTTNTEVQWFHKNQNTNDKIYQFIPNFLTGVTAFVGGITSSYKDLVAVPANVYGEIFMWRDADGKNNGQSGFFKSSATKVDAWSLYLAPEGTNEQINLKFGNGSDSPNFFIRVKTESGASGNQWNYRITYRAI